MQQGLYEKLITQLISSKFETLDQKAFFVKETIVAKSEAAKILSHFLNEVINRGSEIITSPIIKAGKGQQGIFYLHPNEEGVVVLDNYWGKVILKRIL